MSEICPNCGDYLLTDISAYPTTVRFCLTCGYKEVNGKVVDEGIKGNRILITSFCIILISESVRFWLGAEHFDRVIEAIKRSREMKEKGERKIELWRLEE